MNSKTLSVAVRIFTATVSFLFIGGIKLHAQAPTPLLFANDQAAQSLAAAVQDSPDNPLKVLRSRSSNMSAKALQAALDAFAAQRSADPGLSGNGQADAAALGLNLFADTNLPFFFESVRPTADGNGRIVRGAVGADRQGTAIFTIYRGAMSGSVRLPNGEFYDFFVPTSGAGEIRQVRFHGFNHSETDAVIPDNIARDSQSGTTSAGSLDGTESTPLSATITDSGVSLAASTNSVIDVLVAYTSRARQARGDTAGMLAHINQVIAESNAAFANSGLNLSFRIVHAAEVNWNDSSSYMSYGTALSDLRGTADGKLDEVHALRDKYGADLVSLWVNPDTPSSGTFTVGLAYLLTSNPSSFASYAFSVVHQNFAGGTSAAFQHEVGHNLGLNHDPDHGGSNGGIYPDAKGYQQNFLDPKFFTIMAYSSGCSGCQALIQYSNPSVSFQTIPTGIANSINAARALAYVGPFAAGWRNPTTTACAYTASPTNISAGSAGGSYAVNVSSTSNCAWTPVSNASWISLSSGASRSGSGSFSAIVGANSGSGSRSGTISVGGKSVTVNQAGITALPALSVSSTTLSLSASLGATSSVSKKLGVSAGTANLPVTVSGSLPSWLSVSPLSFTTPANITVSANPSGLAAGTYTGTFTLSSPSTANSSVKVTVSFEVKRPNRKFRRSAKGLSFHAESSSQPESQMLLMDSLEEHPVVSASVGDASWLSASPALVDGVWQFTVDVDPRGLAVGVYDSAVAFSCEPSPCDQEPLPVRLTVLEPRAASGPRIGSGAVVNAASFQQGTSAGSWMSIFGENLAGTTRSWQSGDFHGTQMPLALDGVEVHVNGTSAAVNFISPGQVNFQTPSGLSEGWVEVEVKTPNGTDSAWVFASRESPGFFQFDAAGNVAALHPDGTPVGSDSGVSYIGRPAKVGSVLAVYGTGFGPTNPDVPSGYVFSSAAPLASADTVSVTIGGMEAEVQYAGLTGAGLNQVNVKVPSLPPGIHEIVATVADSPTQFHGKLLVQE